MHDPTLPLTIIPLSLATANAFVDAKHRHSRPTRGMKFAVGVLGHGSLLGVAIAGRPVARGADDGLTLEVLRVCTDGTANACSVLYGAARRVGRAMGYQRIITYTLASESGASLRAVGASPVARVRGRQWDCPARRRQLTTETPDRVCWEL